MINNKELISLVRDEVLKVAERMEKPSTYPSTTIAQILWLHHEAKTTEDDIVAKNNPLGLLEPGSETIRTFNSIEECLVVGGDFTIDSEDFTAKKNDICKTNKLYNIDKLYVYNKNDNEIDLDAEKKEPRVDNYQVKKDNATVLKTDSKSDALTKAGNIGGTVINSRGAIVNGATITNKKQTAISYSLKAGAPIECKSVNLYATHTAGTPLRCISGKYYLYNGINYNDRFAICASVDRANGDKMNILGFINRKDITIN